MGCHDEMDDAVVGLLLAMWEKRFSGCFGGCRNIVFIKSDSWLVGWLRVVKIELLAESEIAVGKGR